MFLFVSLLAHLPGSTFTCALQRVKEQHCQGIFWILDAFVVKRVFWSSWDSNSRDADSPFIPLSKHFISGSYTNRKEEENDDLFSWVKHNYWRVRYNWSSKFLSHTFMNWHLFMAREIHSVGKKMRHSKHQTQLCQQKRSKGHNLCADKEGASFLTATLPESADTACLHKSLLQLPSDLSLSIVVPGLEVAKDEVKARRHFEQQICSGGPARGEVSDWSKS